MDVFVLCHNCSVYLDGLSCFYGFSVFHGLPVPRLIFVWFHGFSVKFDVLSIWFHDFSVLFHVLSVKLDGLCVQFHGLYVRLDGLSL